jgi:hypothetical protein
LAHSKEDLSVGLDPSIIVGNEDAFARVYHGGSERSSSHARIYNVDELVDTR